MGNLACPYYIYGIARTIAATKPRTNFDWMSCCAGSARCVLN
jgi:hypothetical protein